MSASSIPYSDAAVRRMWDNYMRWRKAEEAENHCLTAMANFERNFDAALQGSDTGLEMALYCLHLAWAYAQLSLGWREGKPPLGEPKASGAA